MSMAIVVSYHVATTEIGEEFLFYQSRDLVWFVKFVILFQFADKLTTDL